MSGAANGLDIDIEAVLDASRIEDCGVPSGAELLAFVTAVQGGRGDEDAARLALRNAVGEGAFVEAAATLAIFNGLVRVADGTGIALDDGVLGFSAEIRATSGIGVNRFGGAANSDIAYDVAPASTATRDLFG